MHPLVALPSDCIDGQPWWRLNSPRFVLGVARRGAREHHGPRRAAEGDSPKADVCTPQVPRGHKLYTATQLGS